MTFEEVGVDEVRDGPGWGTVGAVGCFCGTNGAKAVVSNASLAGASYFAERDTCRGAFCERIRGELVAGISWWYGAHSDEGFARCDVGGSGLEAGKLMSCVVLHCAEIKTC